MRSHTTQSHPGRYQTVRNVLIFGEITKVIARATSRRVPNTSRGKSAWAPVLIESFDRKFISFYFVNFIQASNLNKIYNDNIKLHDSSMRLVSLVMLILIVRPHC